MLKFNFTIAWRNIWKNKVFSIVNISGLGLSMACCYIISIFVYNELHYDNFHNNIKNIYRVTEKQNQAGVIYNAAVTPGPLAPALEKDFAEIERTVRFGSWSGVLKRGTTIYQEKNILITENSAFSIFNFPLLKGNVQTILQSPDDIVFTEKTAEKYFGKEWRNNPALLGQIFRLNNQTDFKLAGIVNNPPDNSSIQFDILLPLAYLFKTDEWSNKWGANNYHTYLQLKPKAETAAFAKKIEHQLHVYNPATEDLIKLQPLKEQYLYSKFDFSTDWGKRSNVKYVQIFSTVGLLLLLTACVNFINLSTAQSLKRSMEVGVRKVNGASFNQLVGQFLGESVIVAILAGITGLLIVKIANPLLESFTGVMIGANFSSLQFTSLFLLFAVIIGLIAGIYPAFVLSSFKPANILKGSQQSQSGGRFRRVLVVSQFAISITLMISTFFMYRQLKFMQTKNLGFNTEQIVKIRLGNELRNKAALLKRDLENESSIAAAVPATMSLANVDNSADLEWEGMQKGEGFLITQANIDPDFIPALGMQLISGSNFRQQNEKDTVNNFIINETAVKMMGIHAGEVLGKRITFYGAKGTIIGVVKDFHFKPLSYGIQPFIFRYQPWAPYFTMFVKTAPGKTADAIKKIEKYYKKYESETPLEFSFLNDSINELYKEDTRTASVIFLFACLTIFVGCLGLFGLTVFSVEHRIKEIGIRKVLGAGIFSVTTLLSKDFLKLIMLALAIAVPIGWYTSHQWLQNYAYRVELDWWVFAAVGLIVTVIALLTVSIQAIKAAMSNPVNALRSE